MMVWSKHRPLRAARKSRGVTLIELLVTVSVLAILSSIAVPSLQNFTNTSRAVALTNELVAALNFARSEAIKRGVAVTICKTANPDNASPTCTTDGSWQSGWLTFTDPTNRGTVNDGETRLRIKQPTGGTGTIDGGTEFGNYITYLPGGDYVGSGGTNGTLTVCVGGVKRDIAVKNTGQIHIEKGTC